MRPTTIEVYKLSDEDLKKLPKHTKVLIHDLTTDEWTIVENKSCQILFYKKYPEYKAEFYTFVPTDMD